MKERRGEKRYRCVLWVRFDKDGQGEWSAIGHNVSRTGLLLAVGPKLEVGSSLTLQFRLDPEEPEAHRVGGKVVRLDEGDAGDGLWPHRVAIEFDEPPPELAKALEQFAETCEREALAFDSKLTG